MARVFRNASLLLVATTTATALTSSELSPPDPKPWSLEGAKGCMDTSNSKLLIHGGLPDLRRLSTHGHREDDLWEYDVVDNSWTALEPSGDKPSGRNFHVAVMDTKNRKLLIHGGRGASARDDLWEYDVVGNSWTMLSPSGDKPSARERHAAAMDTKNGKLLIHGGLPDLRRLSTHGGRDDDLWEYDLVDNSWTMLEPSGDKPSGRDSHVAAMDTKNSKLLIHGGRGASALDDLWAYDVVGDSWTMLSPSGDKPSAREQHAAAMDTSNSRLLIHGGRGADASALDDLWAYDLVGDSWTMLSPSGDMPPARFGHVAGIADGSRLIIWGGLGRDDAWQFAWVTSTTTTTTTSMTNTSTTSMSTNASTTVDDTRTTVTTTVSLEVSAVCKCSAPSLFFPLFCVAGLATM